MQDILERHVDHWGNWPVYLGYRALSDNYANEWKGRELACHGQRPSHLSILDFAKLVVQTDLAFAGELPSTNNRISYSGLQSPLEQVCSNLMPGKVGTTITR